jgi:hypothetical protein
VPGFRGPVFVWRSEKGEDSQVGNFLLFQSLRPLIHRQLNDLTAQVESLEELLCDIYPQLEPSMAQRVNQRLQDLKLRSPLPQSIPAELPTQSIIPSGNLNLTMLPDVNCNEDFNSDDKVQAMGFVVPRQSKRTPNVLLYPQSIISKAIPRFRLRKM